MKLRDLSAYAEQLENLTKMSCKIERAEDGELYVVETKEAFVYEDETDADEKISSSVEDPRCAAHSKKYKAGKMNKAGEITKPETWTVDVKLNY